MNRKIAFAAIAASAVGVFVLLPRTVAAYRGDPSVEGPNYSQERHEQMTRVFENNDYNTWKELMAGRGRVAQVVTADNFARFAEAHRLSLEGRTEEAAQIRQELGLGLQNGTGGGYGRHAAWQ